jgi:phosphoribosylaminoimidazole-succinocarboxamide synthase
VSARCNPYRDPLLEIPDEIVLETARIYLDAYETITGRELILPRSDVPILARIRANLAEYF